ncbi:3293_t:CDS:1, partial [Ambispora leptoticha]
EYVSVSEVTIQVNAIIELITTDFIGDENVQPTFGTILAQFMNEEDILPDQLPRFIHEFAVKTVENLQLQFPDQEIMTAFQIFDPKQLPTDRCLLVTYGNYEITKIGEFYGRSKIIE